MYYQKTLLLNDNQVTHMCFIMQINIKKCTTLKHDKSLLKYDVKCTLSKTSKLTLLQSALLCVTNYSQASVSL